MVSSIISITLVACEKQSALQWSTVSSPSHWWPVKNGQHFNGQQYHLHHTGGLWKTVGTDIWYVSLNVQLVLSHNTNQGQANLILLVYHSWHSLLLHFRVWGCAVCVEGSLLIFNPQWTMKAIPQCERPFIRSLIHHPYYMSHSVYRGLGRQWSGMTPMAGVIKTVSGRRQSLWSCSDPFKDYKKELLTNLDSQDKKKLFLHLQYPTAPDEVVDNLQAPCMTPLMRHQFQLQ